MFLHNYISKVGWAKYICWYFLINTQVLSHQLKSSVFINPNGFQSRFFSIVNQCRSFSIVKANDYPYISLGPSHRTSSELIYRSIVGYIGKDGHGHAGTDRRTRTDGHGHADTKDGHLWKRRALMEKTDSYGKDGQLWKRRTVMEKTDSYRKDGQLWKRRALMEKTDTYGKDGQLWKRQE